MSSEKQSILIVGLAPDNFVNSFVEKLLDAFEVNSIVKKDLENGGKSLAKLIQDKDYCSIIVPVESVASKNLTVIKSLVQNFPSLVVFGLTQIISEPIRVKIEEAGGVKLYKFAASKIIIQNILEAITSAEEAEATEETEEVKETEATEETEDKKDG